MRILLVAALLVVVAIGGCDGDNGDKATPESGWSDWECRDARKTLEGPERWVFGEDRGLKYYCALGQPGACEAVAQLQADINDNCK